MRHILFIIRQAEKYKQLKIHLVESISIQRKSKLNKDEEEGKNQHRNETINHPLLCFKKNAPRKMGEKKKEKNILILNALWVLCEVKCGCVTYRRIDMRQSIFDAFQQKT